MLTSHKDTPSQAMVVHRSKVSLSTEKTPRALCVHTHASSEMYVNPLDEGHCWVSASESRPDTHKKALLVSLLSITHRIVHTYVHDSAEAVDVCHSVTTLTAIGAHIHDHMKIRCPQLCSKHAYMLDSRSSTWLSCRYLCHYLFCLYSLCSSQSPMLGPFRFSTPMPCKISLSQTAGWSVCFCKSANFHRSCNPTMASGTCHMCCGPHCVMQPHESVHTASCP